MKEWPESNWQIDSDYPRYLLSKIEKPRAFSRKTHLGDSIMTDIVVSSGIRAGSLLTETFNPNPTCTIRGLIPLPAYSTNVYTSAVSPPGGTVTHNWTVVGNATIVGSTTGSSVTVVAGAHGSFTLTDRITRDGCPGQGSKTVPVLYVRVRFTDLARLRFQETDRIRALKRELEKCGAVVNEIGDTLELDFTIDWTLHGAEIETYNDHRMAMCFAILGLKVPGIRIKNPACVKKTFPNFFQKWATPPPHGLGATILDGKTGRKLEVEDLFAN